MSKDATTKLVQSIIEFANRIFWVEFATVMAEGLVPTKRGRPLGSKNKPKKLKERKTKYPPGDLRNQTLKQLILDDIGGGPVSTRTMVDALGVPSSSVRGVLSRLKREGTIYKMPEGLWALTGKNR